MRVRIKRGSDKIFLIKLRYPNGDPVDLTNATQITVKFQSKDGSKLAVNLNQIVALSAFAIFRTVMFSALTPGFAGNAIVLTFDGIKTIAQAVTAWNLINPTNLVTHNSSTPNSVLDPSIVQLASGIDPFFKLIKILPVVLGQMKIHLPPTDTKNLKLADQQAIEVLIDDVITQSITDSGVVIPNAIDVIE